MDLSQRERFLLLVAIVILLPLILFKFLFLPIKQSQEDLVAKIERLETNIEQANLLGQELDYLKRVTETRSVSLTKKVDAVLRKEDLKSRSRIVTEEQPRGGQRLVLKLDEINLSELSKLIYGIENSKPVVMIDNIDINLSFKNKKLFRVSMALISN